jgi:hypothetical protein
VCVCVCVCCFTFTARVTVLSPYTCAPSVTKPENLIKLFVNELVVPTRRTGNRLERTNALLVSESMLLRLNVTCVSY